MIQLAHRSDVPSDVTDQINLLIQVHETARITGLALVALVNDAAPLTSAVMSTRSAEILVAHELGLLVHRLNTQEIAARAEKMMAVETSDAGPPAKTN